MKIEYITKIEISREQLAIIVRDYLKNDDKINTNGDTIIDIVDSQGSTISFFRGARLTIIRKDEPQNMLTVGDRK